MTRLRWLRWLDASVVIRMVFLVLAAFVAVIHPTKFVDVLPWLLLVAVPDLVIVALDRMPVARRGVVDSLVLGLLATSAAAAGVAFALEHTAASLLILVPAYHAGTRFGRFGFLLSSTAGSTAYLLAVAGSDTV